MIRCMMLGHRSWCRCSYCDPLFPVGNFYFCMIIVCFLFFYLFFYFFYHWDKLKFVLNIVDCLSYCWLLWGLVIADLLWCLVGFFSSSSRVSIEMMLWFGCLIYSLFLLFFLLVVLICLMVFVNLLLCYLFVYW